jgi:hypothetical protein
MRALTDASEDSLIDLAWLDRCPQIAPLRDTPAFAEARRKTKERSTALVAVR